MTEKSEIDALKRRSKLSRTKPHMFIEMQREAIEEIRTKIKSARNRMEKNMLYNQIENRKSIIHVLNN